VIAALGKIQVPMVDTQVREVDRHVPAHLGNPVDDLFVDPLPHKRRQRMTSNSSMLSIRSLHEIRALSSHLYATAGYEVAAVQELMAHKDPDMTRAYQKGHARKVLRVEMTLPYGLPRPGNAVREKRAVYGLAAVCRVRENSLRIP